MTNDYNLTWVEWMDADLFLSADSGGVIQLHHFDLAKLTKKISKGKYEDKEEAKRSYRDHVPFGVYQVKNISFPELIKEARKQNCHGNCTVLLSVRHHFVCPFESY